MPSGKFYDLGLTLVLIVLVAELAGSLANYSYPFLLPDWVGETYVWISLHHLFQLCLTIVVMKILRSGKLATWGFNLNRPRVSLQWILWFLLVFGSLEIIRLMSAYSSVVRDPITTSNMIGNQIFQYCLSGFGEEPLFRGFVMSFLTASWSRIYRVGNIEIPETIIIATTIFMLAHISIDWQTLSIAAFDIEQQIKALQLGVVYGLAFHYTGSLLAPIVMHGLSNGLQLTITYYFL